MKKVGIFLITCMFATALMAQSGDSGKPKASIEWKSMEHDFEEIAKGKPVTAKFELKNNSMVPLIITSVRPSCGCTVADYPKEPVKPNEKAFVSVTFDAKSPGYFTKSIKVRSNAEEELMTLYIKGMVK
jgi:hypothetical protein